MATIKELGELSLMLVAGCLAGFAQATGWVLGLGFGVWLLIKVVT